ncbi:mitochondrial 37S ribosomal protein rsm10 [Thoreauomyces humboldtii]|nr:mitochondrial 37S ribosomal protein rsm10 [Thoreauomyces humboldtii]
MSSNPTLTATLTLTTFMPDHLPLLLYFARHSAHCLSLPASEPIHFPVATKKFYVVKGPFVHGKSKEVFEEKKFAGAVQIFDGDTKAVADWVEYVKRNLPSGVDVAVERFTWESLDGPSGKTAPASAPSEAAAAAAAGGATEVDVVTKKVISFEDQVRSKAEELVKSWGAQANATPKPSRPSKDRKSSTPGDK